MREYVQSDEIEYVAKKLIAANHTHLSGTAIAYLMHKVDDEKKDPLALPKKRTGQSHKIASAKLVPDNYFALTGFHFLLTVDERYWLVFDEEKKKALIDHELMHMRKDDDGYYVANHDLEEFADVIIRHGAWKADIRGFFNAVQMPLPFVGTEKADSRPSVQ